MDPSLMPKVWYIETHPANVAHNVGAVVFGGGLCIDSSGLILTAASIVTIPSLNQDECIIKARSFEHHFWSVRLIDKFPQFDLALLQLVSHGQPFDFVSLEGSVSVEVGEYTYGFLHLDQFLFSAVSGYANYQFPADALFPGIFEISALEPPPRNHGHDTFNSTLHYRTVANVLRTTDPGFRHMHRRLPLVQVSGFGKHPGCAGCPLFKLTNAQLIGLFSLRKDGFHFVIPRTFLKKFVDHVRAKHHC